jgi:hypothetical protein
MKLKIDQRTIAEEILTAEVRLVVEEAVIGDTARAINMAAHKYSARRMCTLYQIIFPPSSTPSTTMTADQARLRHIPTIDRLRHA